MSGADTDDADGATAWEDCEATLDATEGTLLDDCGDEAAATAWTSETSNDFHCEWLHARHGRGAGDVPSCRISTLGRPLGGDFARAGAEELDPLDA